ncbi:hypothetical protein AAL_03628 [Moelleriella libera RCEF 2490]|uniref:Uncharacterized protein n=1 Tax=Moelleriella libera RCEF 2490 TaxID=1081109 RepID=A0A168DES1_9HYPO|nr:hypothetical protein AAL_03628 [Moelleriella libera RCEF 2490]
MDIKNYPFLSPEEYSEACHHLDRLYRVAQLGPLRGRWRLRLCTALDSPLAVDGQYTTYIQIIRPLVSHREVELNFGRLSISNHPNDEQYYIGDGEMLDAEKLDEATILKRTASSAPQVTYEIHFHPTYSLPCLWFSLQGLPPDEPAFNIDTVFRHLVPDQYKAGLQAAREIRDIGGISADVGGLAAFTAASYQRS